MVERKDSYSLRSHWKNKWQAERKSVYRGNVHRDAAQLLRIAEDIGVEETRKLIDFYLETRERPDFIWFVYHYDELQESLEAKEADRERRRKLREATIQRLKELDNQGRS